MNKGGAKGVLTGSGHGAAAKAGVGAGGGVGDRDGSPIDWELRPGGMLVQKRELDAPVVQGPQIKVKVSHGLFAHDITISAQATFGDLKKLLVQETSLQPNEMRLLFRGKQKDDSEWLHVAGVKDKAKIILVEDPASRERRLEAMRKQEQVAKACKAVGAVRSEVDKLGGKIQDLEGDIVNGTAVVESQFSILNELLMRQLLKLDGIEADGEAKALRRTEVKRVQSLVEAVDGLKLRNSKPQVPGSSVVVTTQWETFDNGMGSLTAPPPSTIPTFTDWERFD
ncbi:unnamed protein product [Calypogeia fissa]